MRGKKLTNTETEIEITSAALLCFVHCYRFIVWGFIVSWAALKWLHLKKDLTMITIVVDGDVIAVENDVVFDQCLCVVVFVDPVLSRPRACSRRYRRRQWRRQSWRTVGLGGSRTSDRLNGPEETLLSGWAGQRSLDGRRYRDRKWEWEGETAAADDLLWNKDKMMFKAGSCYGRATDTDPQVVSSNPIRNQA